MSSKGGLRPNRVRELWADGRPAVSAWCAIPSAIAVEAVAYLDFDAVTIDMQHGFIDLRDATAMITAIEAAGPTALVRLPWKEDEGLLMRLLDYGLGGVIAPMINSREECERFVRACRYAPAGDRSYTIPRASRYHAGHEEYFDTYRQREIVIAMIETVEGLEEIDGIASVEGLDAQYLGPGDLSVGRYGVRPQLTPPPVTSSKMLRGRWSRPRIDMALRLPSMSSMQRMPRPWLRLASI